MRELNSAMPDISSIYIRPERSEDAAKLRRDNTQRAFWSSDC